MAHLGVGGARNPAPPEWIEFVIADRFKWPLDYVRSLPLADSLRLLTMMSAEAKVHKAKHG